jgi:hypothetical protein
MEWDAMPHACQWLIILPLGFFFIRLFGGPCFGVFFFCFLGLILQMNFHAFGNFKFVVTPRFSIVIHFACVSLETKIGHESLNFIKAFTTNAFSQMLRS